MRGARLKGVSKTQIMRLIILTILMLASCNSIAGYTLHIERENPISLEEWKQVVGEYDFIRISNEDVIGVNPATKEEIRIPMPEGSAEVYFPDQQEWHPMFTFGATIYFNAPKNWEQKNTYIRRLVFKLANKLSAKVVGDEGEEYFE